MLSIENLKNQLFQRHTWEKSINAVIPGNIKDMEEWHWDNKTPLVLRLSGYITQKLTNLLSSIYNPLSKYQSPLWVKIIENEEASSSEYG